MWYPGKRKVIIFFNEKGTALKDVQLMVLNKEIKGLQERDMIVQVYNTGIATAKVKQWHIDVSKPLTIILLGKDGGEKLRSDTVVSTNQFFFLIDAMPMRKTEMGNQ